MVTRRRPLGRDYIVRRSIARYRPSRADFRPRPVASAAHNTALLSSPDGNDADHVAAASRTPGAPNRRILDSARPPLHPGSPKSRPPRIASPSSIRTACSGSPIHLIPRPRSLASTVFRQLVDVVQLNLSMVQDRTFRSIRAGDREAVAAPARRHSGGRHRPPCSVETFQSKPKSSGP